MKPRLVVIVDGGLIQEIFSNVEAEVLVLDCDTDGFDDLKKIRGWDFKGATPSEETFEVFDTEPREPFADPVAVEHYFNEMQKESEFIEE